MPVLSYVLGWSGALAGPPRDQLTGDELMNQDYPVPPAELVEQWFDEFWLDGVEAAVDGRDIHMVTQAARWGADQELEACCEWLRRQNLVTHCALIPSLRAARRTKPPSLKEQALDALESADGADFPFVATVLTADQHALIRAELVLRRVRALLAQPEPEGPTDEEIMELMPPEMHTDLAAAARAMTKQAGTDSTRVKGLHRIILNRHAVDHARAVLARYGNSKLGGN